MSSPGFSDFPHALPAGHPWWGSRRYWVLQGLGWGGMFLFASSLILLSAAASPAGPESGARQWADLRFSGLTSVSGLIATHGLRWLMIVQGWKRLRPRALLARSLAAWALLTIVLALLGAFFFASPVPGESLGETLMPCLMMNLTMLGAWLALYWLIHIHEAWHAANLDRQRLRATGAEQQLRALQAQLHPHFLFNSLNTIRSLTPSSATAARQAITTLADLLRASLMEAGTHTISLARELEHVRLYVEMEKFRFKEQLRYEEDIPSVLLSAPVLPLMLLTLAENAMKHGWIRGGAGGTLTLRASRHEDQLILRMTSPGSLTATTAHGREESFGIGWANVQERLSLVFGPAARLRPAEADGLVTVEIRIPQPRPSPT